MSHKKFDPFDDSFLNETLKEKEELCRKEVEGMVKRALRCPRCGYAIMYVYDCQGHFDIKCPRCNRISVLDTKYFKHQKTPKIYPGIHILPDFAW